jgi:hypothetical protein
VGAQVSQGQCIDVPARPKTVLQLEPLDCCLGPRTKLAIDGAGSVAEPAQIPLDLPHPLRADRAAVAGTWPQRTRASVPASGWVLRCGARVLVGVPDGAPVPSGRRQRRDLKLRGGHRTVGPWRAAAVGTKAPQRRLINDPGRADAMLHLEPLNGGLGSRPEQSVERTEVIAEAAQQPL